MKIREADVKRGSRHNFSGGDQIAVALTNAPLTIRYRTGEANRDFGPFPWNGLRYDYIWSHEKDK